MNNQNQQKNKTVSLLSALLILALGVVLIVFNKIVTGQGVVVLAGILFLLTGIINLVMFVTRRNSDGTHVNRGLSLVFGWLVSLAAMILGICMLVFIDTFNTLIPFIFALLIFFGALTLMFSFIFGMRKVSGVPGWLWISPIAMIVLGVITILQKTNGSDHLVMILTGVSMAIFGLTGIIGVTIMANARRRARKLNSDVAAIQKVESQKPEVVDVEHKEVDSPENA